MPPRLLVGAPQTVHPACQLRQERPAHVTIRAIARNGHTRVDINAVVRLT